jgi:tyrosyl-tRNA synthetase
LSFTRFTPILPSSPPSQGIDSQIKFFIKLPDTVLERYLKMFTLLSLPDISSTISRHAIHPELRTAHHLLAKEVVTLIHGPAKASEAELTTRLLFRTEAHHASPSAAEILSSFEDRIVVMPRQELVGEMLTKVARRVNAVNTRAEAENAIRGGGLYVGLENLKVRDVRAMVEEEWLVGGEVLIMRFGKGRFSIVKAV